MQFLWKTLTYGVFGPIILHYALWEFFCCHFYARRRGRILIMPAPSHTFQLWTQNYLSMVEYWRFGVVSYQNIANCLCVYCCMNISRFGFGGESVCVVRGAWSVLRKNTKLKKQMSKKKHPILESILHKCLQFT